VVLFLRHFRETPQQIVKAAQAYAAAGDYQRALEQYKSLNAKFPASVEARAADPVIKQIEKEVEAQKLVKLGANLNKQGNPRKAVETYSAVLSGFAGTRAAERAAQLDRQARDSAHSLALAAAKDLLAKSDWEGARKAAEEALYFLPGSQEAAAVHHHALYRLYRDRGEEALRQGRKPEALDLLKKALEYNHAPDLVRIVAAIEAELGSSKLLASLIPQIQGSPPGEWQWLQEMIAGLRPGIDGIWEAVRNPARAGITKSHTRAELMLALHNLGEKEALPQLLQLLDGRAPAGFTLQGEPEGLYAAAALAKMGLSSLPLLAERLKADNLPRAVWCARALARLGAAAVEPLAAGAASEDAQLSGSCFDALKQIGKPASEALALLLNDARVDIRKRARAVLVSLGPQAAEGIFAMLPRAAKVGLEEAVGALADMGPPVVPNLVVAHARRPGLERLTADRVLGYVGEEALPYLLTAIAAEDKATRSAALEMVRAQGGKLTAGLLEAAEGKDPIPENIRLALDTLDQLAVPTLLTAFRSSSLKTRKTAELFLAALGPRALSGLMQIVQSPQIPLEIRQRALELAGRIGPTAIPSLALVLQSDAPALADAARHIIIRFGEEAVPYLRTLLRDDSATTRLRAMLLLWDIKGEAALPDVKSMLQDPSENVRLVAVELVGKAAGEQPVDVLVPLLRDKSARVRSAVVDTLAQLGGAKAVRALVMALDGWAPSSLDELKRLILGFGEQAIPALREACYNKNFGARGDVLDILARIGSPAAWDVLAVALDDDDPLIREKAARCLGNSAKTVFVPTLLRHIRDGAVAVRAAVVEALGNLGDRQAVDEIANRLKVDFPVVRLAAVEALAKLGGPEALAALVQAAKQDPSEAVRRAARAALQRMNPAAFGGTLLAP
jgi:HEAT repeat protein